MKKTLVNHGGIVQWKFIISNDKELMEYAKHKSIVLSEELRGIISSKPDASETNTQQILRLTSEIHRVPLITAGNVLLHKVIMSMHALILKGKTLVVNQAGGYCPWDDNFMALADENAAESLKENKNAITSNLTAGPILVLENQGDIPEPVKKYINLTLNSSTFSFIKNIQFGKDKLSELLIKALESRHDTIVVQTTMMDENQIILIVDLLEKIPVKINFHINTANNLKETLEEKAGKDRVEFLFQKHNIIQW